MTQHFQQTLEVVTEVAPQIVAYIDPLQFWEKLDDFQEELRGDDFLATLVTGTVALTSLGLTVG